MSWRTALSWATKIGGWLLGFLNSKVDADARVEIAKIGAVQTGFNAIQNADNLNAKRSPWEPIMILAAILFAFFVLHAVMIVLDSIPFHIVLGDWFLPTWKAHKTGSWDVKALPAPFDTTEHAILQSVFIGASAAVGTLAVIRRLRK